MNPYISRLITHIPGGLPVPQDLAPALTISGFESAAIVGTTLYLTINNESTSFDLFNITVQQLADQMSAYTAVTVAQNGIVELLTFANGQTSISLPGALYLPTDETYAVLGMMARTLEGNKRSATQEAAQMNLQVAATLCADWWGASTGIPRIQGEPDSIYTQRILNMRFRPIQNNLALEQLFATLGYSAQVTDTSPGLFAVTIQNDPSPVDGFLYTRSNLELIIDKVKSGGYQYLIYLTYSFAAQNIVAARSVPIITVTRAVYANNGGANKVGSVLNGNWALDGTQTLDGVWEAGPIPVASVNLTRTVTVPTAQYPQTTGYLLDGGRRLDGTWDLSGATTVLVSVGVQKAVEASKTITHTVTAVRSASVRVTCYPAENNTPFLSGAWALDGTKTLNGRTAASASVYLDGAQVA